MSPRRRSAPNGLERSVKIVDVETFPVGAGWKNWLFVRVLTDEGVHGVGEATLNGFTMTCQAAVHELKALVVGSDPRRVRANSAALYQRVSNEGGHVHRAAIAGLEEACWDILGKSLGVPVYQLFGGPVRDTVDCYANGWYRTERSAEAFAEAAGAAVDLGFRALKFDPLGTAQGFLAPGELGAARDIIAAVRGAAGPGSRLMIEQPTADVAARTTGRVATGENCHTVGQFLTLAQAGGISIYQPEPMSLGGLLPTAAVAEIAAADGAWIAPHQSGGPVATAVCLQLAAFVPNFLIQEYFDPFNEPWTHSLVSWTPVLDRQTGRLSLPDAPGLGIDLDLDVARSHPYDPHAYLDVTAAGWERRLGHPGAVTRHNGGGR
jgi:galactonate dehydratase